MRKVILGLVLTILSGAAAMAASPQVVTFDSIDLTTADVRSSGEITITQVVVLDGREVTIQLSFPDFATASNIGPENRQIDLSTIRQVMMIGLDGEPTFVNVRDLNQIMSLVDQTNRSICGDNFARTFVEIGKTSVAVDFTRPGADTSNRATTGEAEPVAVGVSCYYSYVDDVDDDCDRYAVGGCGGPGCRDYWQKTCFPSEGYPYVAASGYTNGSCKVKVINWWPDTCYCG